LPEKGVKSLSFNQKKGYISKNRSWKNEKGKNVHLEHPSRSKSEEGIPKLSLLRHPLF